MIPIPTSKDTPIMVIFLSFNGCFVSERFAIPSISISVARRAALATGKGNEANKPTIFGNNEMITIIPHAHRKGIMRNCFVNLTKPAVVGSGTTAIVENTAEKNEKLPLSTLPDLAGHEIVLYYLR
jgi:hypothetical protein